MLSLQRGWRRWQRLSDQQNGAALMPEAEAGLNFGGGRKTDEEKKAPEEEEAAGAS